MKNIEKYNTFINERINEKENTNDFIIEYNSDKYVCHITSKSIEEKIKKEGFKTGNELNVAEKRNAIFFSDKDVNYGVYARNKEGELYEGEEIGEVCVNIKNLKLLNINYKEDGIYINHKRYNNFVIKGEIDKIPFDIDGTISFLPDGRIYEVCLPKNIANNLI